MRILPTKSVIRSILIILVLLTVSCRGGSVIQVAEFAQQNQTLPATITVVNWNAQKGKHPNFARDLKLLIDKERPDIVFLQEATSDLFEIGKMGGYFAEGWHYPWPNGVKIGVLTLSRIPPVRVQPVPTKYRELGITAPKVSLVSEYPLLNGDRLLTLNVHLLNFERWSVKKIRHQIEALKEIMANHSGPILITGDFNTWNQKRLELIREVTQDMKLKEVDQFPTGRRTGDVNSVFWNGLLGIDKDIPIDRVYIRGFTPTKARVLAYQSSDHSPILFSLAVNP